MKGIVSGGLCGVVLYGAYMLQGGADTTLDCTPGVNCIEDVVAAIEPCDRSTGQNCVTTAMEACEANANCDAAKLKAAIAPCDKSTGIGCITDAITTAMTPCDKSTGVGCINDTASESAPCDRTTGVGC